MHDAINIGNNKFCFKHNFKSINFNSEVQKILNAPTQVYFHKTEPRIWF